MNRILNITNHSRFPVCPRTKKHNVSDPSKVGQINKKRPDFIKMLHPWFSQDQYIAIKILIGLNCSILILQTVASSGQAVLSPSAELMIQWGADYGPATLHGEWWRTFTSMFLHFGILHLACNVWAMWDFGRPAERLFGSKKFILLYLLSGLCGSVTSLLWHPDVCSAGASGALFGVFGALLSFFYARRNQFDQKQFSEANNAAVMILVSSLVIGAISGFDNAAHIGGFFMGMACGWLYLPDSASLNARMRLGGTLGFAGLIVAIAVVATTVPIDFNRTYWLSEGYYLEEKGHRKEALAAFEEQLITKPNDPQTLAYKANIEVTMGKFDDAIDDASQALCDKDAQWARGVRGEAYACSGKFDLALRDFQKLIDKHDRDEMNYRAKKATVYRVMGDDKSALSELDAVIRGGKDTIGAQILRAYILKESGNMRGALLDVKDIIGHQLSASEGYTLLNRENMRYAFQDYKGVIEDANQVLHGQGSDNLKTYAPILKYLANRHLGQVNSLDQLKQDVERLPYKEWPYPILMYLEGGITSDELLKQADDISKLTEAKTIIGINLAETKDKRSTEMFEWVKKHGNLFYVEYELARSQLAKNTGAASLNKNAEN